MPTDTLSDRSTIHACVFERGEDLFGVEARAVVQITFQPHLTTVPAAPSFVQGAMNLRGEIVPLVAIDAEIGVDPGRSFPMQNPVVVLQTDFGLVAVPVERVLSVTELPVDVRDGQVEGEANARYVQAICEMQGRVVTILDFERLFRDLQQRVRSN